VLAPRRINRKKEKSLMAMPVYSMRQLLEAGIHFGHQTRRWNPKMRRFIHGEREGIYIIDLLKTEDSLKKAQDFAEGIARRGGVVLFVGTKKQARDGIKEIAEANAQADRLMQDAAALPGLGPALASLAECHEYESRSDADPGM
jgi:hypothetical protein